jgi:antitoxin ParD1/3/4
MVKAKVASGMYNNASEVIRESLRFMEIHEAWIYQIKLEKLRSEVSKGFLNSRTISGIDPTPIQVTH